MLVKRSLLNKDIYKPGEIAAMLSVSVRTVQNYCQKGALEEGFTETGRRYIPHDSLVSYLEENDLIIEDLDDLRYDAIYARVSPHKQKKGGDLEHQISDLMIFASTRNPKDLKVYSEVASGLNDNRRELNKLIKDVLEGKVSRIFINYKDRLTRFGFNYLKNLCDFKNTEIIIASSEGFDKSLEEELAEDIISVIHSFSGKLYGMRKKVKNDIVKELDNETSREANL